MSTVLCVYAVSKDAVCDCRDRLTGNDAIGTTYLNLAKIASSGGEIEGMILGKKNTYLLQIEIKC